MNEPISHHFVPVFYLTNWCENDGMVPFSMRRGDGSILQSRVKPSKTAFENRLYSYKKVPKEQRQAVEKLFFTTDVDTKAAPILRKIVAGKIGFLSPEERVDWTLFLIAARLRVPEIVNDLKKTATEELRRSLTDDHEEYLTAEGDARMLVGWTEQKFVGLIDNFGMMILPDIITDPEYTGIIAGMHWWTEDVSGANVQFLTSDRPLWVSTGVMKPNCLLALPLSPTRIFFASRNRDLQSALHREAANRLARRCNESIVSQAARFVYGRSSKNFINRRLGK